ncbi:ferritin-like domain-containing protein [Pseudoduganella lutea]|uniref:Ferritin-like domain-containing protein n=1 Tax=Pseudoduganella lutea TaxID=321985 RepID=A0A4P6L7B3_9BURK|nr:ferritin-like domain-containing protein [Pseudoduganella lutea]QBE67527.1 ferritin-like domain-containing protein [Pseudoduganella lutea]
MPELRAWAQRCLLDTDPVSKTDEVARMAAAYASGACTLDPSAALADSPAIPGRPARPELVPPRQVGRRSMATPEGRAMLVHALAHIEFNAVNLALDALWRFAGMPAQYYADWLRVASEEATHYRLLAGHLATLGHAYGDFAGHDSLWEMVDRTRGDVTARMALVPRTLEARGLDAVPPLRAKVAQAGDMAAAHILDIILRDEVGHVEIGNRWYRWLCERQGLEPYATYDAFVVRYRAPVLKGPFNLEARRLAGFTDEELERLGALTGTDGEAQAS